MKRTTADAIQKTAKQISQARRKASLQKRKDYIQSLPDAPPLICLSELAEKTQLPFQMLRTLIVIEGKIPYIMVGKKYFVNYSHFIRLYSRIFPDSQEKQKMDTKSIWSCTPTGLSLFL